MSKDGVMEFSDFVYHMAFMETLHSPWYFKCLTRNPGTHDGLILEFRLRGTKKMQSVAWTAELDERWSRWWNRARSIEPITARFRRVLRILADPNVRLRDRGSTHLAAMRREAAAAIPWG